MAEAALCGGEQTAHPESGVALRINTAQINAAAVSTLQQREKRKRHRVKVNVLNTPQGETEQENCRGYEIISNISPSVEIQFHSP